MYELQYKNKRLSTPYETLTAVEIGKKGEASSNNNSTLKQVAMPGSFAETFGLFLLHNYLCSKPAIVAFCLLFSISNSFAQTTYYSRATGDWDVTSTWSTVACGNATNTGTFPVAGDSVIICNTHTVTIQNNEEVEGLRVEAGGRLDDGGKRPIITGNIVMDGTFIITGRSALNGVGTNIDGLGTFAASGASRVEITGNKTILATANLTFTGGVSQRFQLMTGATTITNKGKVTILSGRFEGPGTWVNDINSTLNIGARGNFFSVTTFTASAAGNTVNYYGSAAQDIRCPTSSTYWHLSISGTSVKTLLCNIFVNGNLSLNSGTLDATATNYNINIEGNWNNLGGIFLERKGTVEFDGTAAQSITNLLGETFWNLEIDKASGTLALNNDITVDSILTMTQGNIDATTGKLILGTSTVNVGTLTYVGGTIIGKFERWINATSPTTWLFPIGTAADYRPALFTFTDLTTSGSLIGEFISSAPGNNGLSLVDGGVTIYNTFVEGYWDFNPGLDTAIGSNDYDIELTGNGFTSFTINAATRLLTRANDGSPWAAEGTHVAATPPTAKRSVIITDFPAQHCFADSTNCTGPSTSPITGAADVCASSTGVNYSVTSLSTSTYTWTITGGTANPAPGANDTSITVDWSATGQVGDVQVVENNGCSDGAPVNYSVNIHSLPPSSITGKTSVPENAVGEIYSVTAQAGYTFTWTISGGTSDPNPATGQGTNSITVDWGAPGAGNVSVVADSGGCASAPAVDIDVNIYDVIFSIANNDWDVAATWDCNCIPLVTDNVVITTHIVTLQADATINNFTINSTGTLDANGMNFTVTADITVNGTYGGTASTLTLEGINTTISGTGSFTNTGGITINTGAKTILNTAALTKNSGDITIDAVTVTNNGSITLGGSIIGVGAAIWTNTASSTLNIGGALLTTGTLSASSTGNTVNYNGTGAQTIKTPSGTPAQYHHFTSSTSGTKTMGAALDINGNLTITTATLASGGFNINLAGNWINSGGFTAGANTVIFDGTTTISGTSATSFNNITISGTLTGVSGGNFNVAGNWVNNGTYNHNTGLVTFNGTSTVSGTAVTSFNNVTVFTANALTGSAGSMNMAGDLVNNGTFTHNGGTVTFNGSSSLSGTGIISFNNVSITGILIPIAASNFNVAGNWNNTGTFIHNSGTVTFNGTVAQSITSAGGETFYNLTINKSAGDVTLANAATVINILTLTSGDIITSTSNLLILETGATVSGGSVSSYVNGPMDKKTISTALFDFPVGGDSTIYRKIGVTPVSAAAHTWRVQAIDTGYADTAMGPGLHHVSGTCDGPPPCPASGLINGGHYWTIDRISGASGAVIKMYWYDGNDSINNLADLRVARHDGTRWQSEGNDGTTGTFATGDIISDTVTTFSPFTLGSVSSANPLPIDLLSFDAKLNDDKVDLFWATASETNNDYFTIQRSVDGVDFENVTYVAGAGNSSHRLYYTAIDNDPYYGVSYYRLKQTDYDGKYEYSKVIAINYLLNEDYNIAVYPNPSDGSFYVNIKGNKDDEVLVVVIDVLGKEHYSKVIILDEGEYILAVDPYDKLPP
ncbi:hypothetical protein JYU16_01845, partial [bacterium AH-315-M05]|nr:hypothetical protein [bacterium AH-315-M05]